MALNKYHKSCVNVQLEMQMRAGLGFRISSTIDQQLKHECEQNTAKIISALKKRSKIYPKMMEAHPAKRKSDEA